MINLCSLHCLCPSNANKTQIVAFGSGFCQFCYFHFSTKRFAKGKLQLVIDWRLIGGIQIRVPFHLAKMVGFLVISIFSLFSISRGFSIAPRILNGDLSNPEEFPFYVQIVLRDENLCGGTLISDRWNFYSNKFRLYNRIL